MTQSTPSPPQGGAGDAGRESAHRRPYRPPELRELGHVADVTHKTGMNLDMNQSRKVGAG